MGWPMVSRRRLSGLNTEVDPHIAPEGSLAKALNVVCRRAGTIEPRPGLYQSSQLSNLATAQAAHSYDGNVTIIDDTESVQAVSGSNITNQDFGAGAVAGYDGFCSAVEANGNLYIASQDGVQKVLAHTGTGAFMAGEHQFQEVLIAAVNNSSRAAENWLANGDSVAYRAVLRTEDGNGVVTRSAPSTPYFVTNSSGGARRVQVTVYVNDEGYYSNTYIELYRTKANAVSTPAQEYFLALEHPVTAFVVSSGSVTLYDTLPDDELGIELYSNPGEQGEIYYPPQRAKALASFAGSLFAGNLTSPQNKFVNFKLTAPNNSSVTANLDLTNGSPTGTLNSETPNYDGASFVEGMMVHHATYFPNGALVTDITGSTVTFSENAGASGSGLSIESYDTIEITDGTTTETYLSYYVVYNVMTNVASGFNPITTGPSQLVTARWIQGYNSAAGLTDYSCYLEELPGTSVTLQIRATNAQARYSSEINEYASGFADFDQDIKPALIEWSNVDEPETFIRGISELYIGDKGKAVWSMVPSANRLYITKAGEGIYTLDGESEQSGFRLQRLTKRYHPMSPRHICDGTKGLYVWTDKGVIQIGASGSIDNVSEQRVNTKLEVFEAAETGLEGCMFSADNEIHLVARQTLANVERTLHLVYHEQTDQWTEWDIAETPIAGCSPGVPLYGQQAKFSLLTEDSGDVRLWSAPTVITDSGNEVPPDWYWGDHRAASSQILDVPTATSEDNVFTFDFDFTFYQQTIPSAGDMLIGTDHDWKGIVTGVEDLGGFNRRVTFYSRDNAAVSTTMQILFAFDTEVQLNAQTSDDPLLWHHWVSAHWEMSSPLSIYKTTVGSTSSMSPTESEVVQRAGNYATFSATTPTQPGFAPRYLYTPKHSRARTVSPYFKSHEVSSWRLTAVSLKEYQVSYTSVRN